MSADLLSCPFCGGEAIMSSWETRGDGADRFPQDVVCMGCGIGFCGHDAKGQGDAFVAALWNRRTTPVQSDAPAALDLAVIAIKAADEQGVVLTVYQVPRLPLAMGNYSTRVVVRPVCERAA